MLDKPNDEPSRENIRVMMVNGGGDGGGDVGGDGDGDVGGGDGCYKILLLI